MKKRSPEDIKAAFSSQVALKAAAVMEPRTSNRGRPPKQDARTVRRSAVLPPSVDKAIMEESLAMSAKAKKHVSYNEVLCSILIDWEKKGRKRGSP